jgi:hypothetical protein
LGGDIKALQQLADIRRISELGSALNAARGMVVDSSFLLIAREEPPEGTIADGRIQEVGWGAIELEARK